MNYLCRSAKLAGTVDIPGSKSHTIRAVVIAALADGESRIDAPLVSADALSALEAARALGANVRQCDTCWWIQGCGGRPVATRDTIDIGNSGTTLRIMMGAASLLREGSVRLTGDEQIRRRPAGPLAEALNQLGAHVVSEGGNGCAPFLVSGLLEGGRCAIEAPTSQYVTSLLLAAPLAAGNTTIDVLELNEKPYVRMTLDWLRDQGVQVHAEPEMRGFEVKGGRQYHAFRKRIPADFSSATFFLAAGALPGNRTLCRGLDMGDSQADRKVVDYLRVFGADVSVSHDRIEVSCRNLVGTEFNLSETPDALPMMAVLGCFAEGETRLTHVAHARIKETDRIAVMRNELGKMGADIEERADGLVIRGCDLHGADVEGHGDHRVVMALAIAAQAAQGETRISTAEAAGVTFPAFPHLLANIGGAIEIR